MYVDSGKSSDTVISRRKDRLRPKSLEVWWKRQINPADKLIGLRYPAVKEAMVTHTRVKKTRERRRSAKEAFHPKKLCPSCPLPPSPPLPPPVLLYPFRGKSKEKWRGNGSNCRKDKIRFAARLSTRSRRVGLQGSSTPSVLYICLFVAVSAGLTVTPAK